MSYIRKRRGGQQQQRSSSSSKEQKVVTTHRSKRLISAALPWTRAKSFEGERKTQGRCARRRRRQRRRQRRAAAVVGGVGREGRRRRRKGGSGGEIVHNNNNNNKLNISTLHSSTLASPQQQLTPLRRPAYACHAGTPSIHELIWPGETKPFLVYRVDKAGRVHSMVQ